MCASAAKGQGVQGRQQRERSGKCNRTHVTCSTHTAECHERGRKGQSNSIGQETWAGKNVSGAAGALAGALAEARCGRGDWPQPVFLLSCTCRGSPLRMTAMASTASSSVFTLCGQAGRTERVGAGHVALPGSWAARPATRQACTSRQGCPPSPAELSSTPAQCARPLAHTRKGAARRPRLGGSTAPARAARPTLSKPMRSTLYSPPLRTRTSAPRPSIEMKAASSAGGWSRRDSRSRSGAAQAAGPEGWVRSLPGCPLGAGQPQQRPRSADDKQHTEAGQQAGAQVAGQAPPRRSTRGPAPPAGRSGPPAVAHPRSSRSAFAARGWGCPARWGRAARGCTPPRPPTAAEGRGRACVSGGKGPGCISAPPGGNGLFAGCQGGAGLRLPPRQAEWAGVPGPPASAGRAGVVKGDGDGAGFPAGPAALAACPPAPCRTPLQSRCPGCGSCGSARRCRRRSARRGWHAWHAWRGRSATARRRRMGVGPCSQWLVAAPAVVGKAGQALGHPASCV